MWEMQYEYVGGKKMYLWFVVQVRINAFDARCSRNDDTKETSNSYKESSIVNNYVLYLAS